MVCYMSNHISFLKMLCELDIIHIIYTFGFGRSIKGNYNRITVCYMIY